MDMNAKRVSNASQANSSSGGDNRVEALQRRLQQLNKQMQEVNNGDLDPKIKQQKLKQLQDAIKLVQQQIAEAVRQHQGQQGDIAGRTQTSQASQNRTLAGGPGGIIDTKA